MVDLVVCTEDGEVFMMAVLPAPPFLAECGVGGGDEVVVDFESNFWGC